MDVLVERCAGLDVHRDTVVATVRLPAEAGQRKQRQQQTRTFTTTTAGITELGDWLAGHQVTRVGMESTGVYWKPVYYLLEDSFEVWLLNAEHLHNVPGRKTDVADSVWIAQLVEHGLVRPSFVPPPPIRELRDLTRHRRTLVEERTRVVQRLEKVLQDAGIKLTSVASALLTKSGRVILEALLAGEQDPATLAELAKGRLRAKIPALTEALAGRFRAEHHGLLAAQMLAHIDFLDAAIGDLDQRLDQVATPFQPVGEPGAHHPRNLPTHRDHAARRMRRGHVGLPHRSTPGQLGRDLPRQQHLRRQKPLRAHPAPLIALRTALTEAAHAAARTKGTYLAAHHAQIRGRRGLPKAIGATRHDILIAYWHVIHDNVNYHDLGPNWANRRLTDEQRTRKLLHQLQALGHQVTITPAA